MKRWLLLVACAWLAASGPAHAVSLSLEPPTQTIALNGTASVDLVLSGLGDGVPPSVGTWDVTLVFDATRLQLVAFDVGLALGDDLVLDSDSGTGTIEVAVTSLLTAAELDALQGDPLVLATFSFMGIGGGIGAISIGSPLLGDAFGAQITLDSVAGASITVPEASWLVAAVLGVLAWRRSR